MPRDRRLPPAILLTSLAIGCSPEASDSSTGSFDEFMQEWVEPHPMMANAYLVEGDIRLHGEDELAAYYARLVRGGVLDDAEDDALKARSLVIELGNGDPILLRADERLQLSYCISRAPGDFPDPGDYAELVAELRTAALDWERATDVNFIHRPQFDDDSSCIDYDPSGPTFRVRRQNGSSCEGNAFGPGTLHIPQSTSYRVLWVEGVGSGCNEPNELAGVLRHELGHIIGLGHEMGHPNYPDDPDYGEGVVANPAQACSSYAIDSDLTLSPYDPHSVMMYYFCDLDGAAGNDFLSRFDVQAAQFLYTAPRVTDTDYDGDGLADVYFYTSDTGQGDAILYGGDPLSLQSTAPGIPYAPYLPLPGDYDGDGQTDLLMYSPLSQGMAGEERLYVKDAVGDDFTEEFSFHFQSLLQQPSIGNFYEGGTPDVLFLQQFFWSSPPGLPGYVLAPMMNYSPINALRDNDWYHTQLVGDFDGNAVDDILWVDGSTDAANSDRWITKPIDDITWSTATIDHTTKGLLGHNTSSFFYSTATADFDGDGATDVLFYAPGQDVVVWMGGLSGPGSTVHQLTDPFASGSIYKIFAHDFDGDGHDELYWHDQVGSLDRIWSFTLGGRGAQYQETTISATHAQHQEMLPITGNFRHNGSGFAAPRAEIYWWNPLGSSELWVLDGGGVFQPETAPSGEGFPVGYALR